MKNFEIKIRVEDVDLPRITKVFSQLEIFATDHQIDHYFNVPEGRLKLRISEVENALVQYKRQEEWPKISKYHLCRFDVGDSKLTDLLICLQNSLGTKVVVDKRREIYYDGLAKIHFDAVQGLEGFFVEIEIRDEKEEYSDEHLRQILDGWIVRFGLDESQAVDCSYSDLLMEKN